MQNYIIFAVKPKGHNFSPFLRPRVLFIPGNSSAIINHDGGKICSLYLKLGKIAHKLSYYFMKSLSLKSGRNMKVYFLFTYIDEEYICNNIYAEEEGKVINYSVEEDYIVKAEDPAVKSLAKLEEMYEPRAKGKKGTRTAAKQENPPKLIQKEFDDVREALYFLEGTLEDFNEEIPARRKLLPIVNPYDLDFEEDKDEFPVFGESDVDLEKEGFFEDDELDDFGVDGDEDEEDDFGGNFDDDEDDKY